jgi:thiamine monophosphate synthase
MKKFLITDSKYYSRNIQKFSFFIYRACKIHRPFGVILRDKSGKNIKNLAKQLKNISKRLKFKVFINQYGMIAKELNLGVHLTSKQHNQIKYQKKNKKNSKYALL